VPLEPGFTGLFASRPDAGERTPPGDPRAGGDRRLSGLRREVERVERTIEEEGTALNDAQRRQARSERDLAKARDRRDRLIARAEGLPRSPRTAS
jgi:chromosome segregation ATPase